MRTHTVAGSFRDPSGHLFYSDGRLYRQVNACYKENYDQLMTSGLYEALSTSGLLVPHRESGPSGAQTDPSRTQSDPSGAHPGNVYRVIEPDVIPFVSYPFEWCFSQLKDAALLTLEIQKKALEFGMTLKDCSNYNVQFKGGKPVFIDTLSFERYMEGRPWVAYRQFCQHFLAPLALMHYKDILLNQLLRNHLDGIPLDLASTLLPWRTNLVFSLLSHIHLHAKSQKQFADKAVDVEKHTMGRLAFLGLIDSCESAIRRLKWSSGSTEWSAYYECTNYSAAALGHKKEIIGAYLERTKGDIVWDFGANTGVFSRLASNRGIYTVAFDNDPAAVEINYRECVKNNETALLPLQLDITNPSPGLGWNNRERMSLLERGPADTACALALVHHLALSNNLPLGKIAEFFRCVCGNLIIEFVPKRDSQVQRILATREDIFPEYTQEAFEEEFLPYFTILDSTPIKDSDRTVYLMSGKQV